MTATRPSQIARDLSDRLDLVQTRICDSPDLTETRLCDRLNLMEARLMAVIE